MKAWSVYQNFPCFIIPASEKNYENIWVTLSMLLTWTNECVRACIYIYIYIYTHTHTHTHTHRELVMTEQHCKTNFGNYHKETFNNLQKDRNFFFLKSWKWLINFKKFNKRRSYDTNSLLVVKGFFQYYSTCWKFSF